VAGIRDGKILGRIRVEEHAVEQVAIVVPWHDERQRNQFVRAWGNPPFEGSFPQHIVLQHDANREGCAVTKNKGIDEAVRRGADIVIVLDDDCYPGETQSLAELAERHVAALNDQPVRMFETVTEPPSRGTPYAILDVPMPVAASMGYWFNVGDYCAVRQLSFQNAAMAFKRETVFGKYFPLCGMNIAFRPREWMPWCRFIDVPRFDDIWMGWLWQREAYRRGYCFNLGGPIITHARQSNVWQNLTDEAVYLERNETLWREIMTHEDGSYGALRDLLPI
jgi:hypothetical protein